jgi:tetratricopeptide (TPR) repeat protein
MFRLLGLHAGPDISVPGAAALADTSEDEASTALDRLAGAHLIAEAVPGRYRFHDLLGAYAVERASADENPAGRTAAIRRLLTWYLHTLDAADRILIPSRRHLALDPPPPHCEPVAFTGYEQSLAWCDTEHAALVAAVGRAAETGHDDIAWQLPVAMWCYLALRKPWADWIACCSIGLTAAARTGNTFGESWVLNGLATAYCGLRRFDEGVICFQRALVIVSEAGRQREQGALLNNLGATYFGLGRFEDALGCFLQALDIARETGDRYGEGLMLDNIGEAYQHMDQPDNAFASHRQALAIARETADRHIEGSSLNNLGRTHRLLQQPTEANKFYQQALSARCRAGDRHGKAETFRELGDLLLDGGNATDARRSWQQALAIFDVLGSPEAEEVRQQLETLRSVTGEADV